MTDRQQKNLYIFLSDENSKYLRAKQTASGDYVISRNAQPYPIYHNPANLANIPFEFATNKEYHSMNRSVSYPLEFEQDGAAILRDLYYNGKGVNQDCFITIMGWNGRIYELYYAGKIDFGQKSEDPKTGRFTVPSVDDSAWGVLSRNDKVQYSIECNESNPKAIRVLFDGINLKNRYVFQTVRGDYEITEGFRIPGPGPGTIGVTYYLPIVEINQEGDSVGVITKNVEFSDPNDDLELDFWFMRNTATVSEITVEGTFSFIWNTPSSTHAPEFIRIQLRQQPGGTFFGQGLNIGQMSVEGNVYSFPFSFSTTAFVNKKLFLYLELKCNCTVSDPLIITIIPTNIFVGTKTRPEARVVYALRPGDLMQQLVEKATDGRFTMHSNFFVDNDKSVLTCGDALRGIDTAKIYSSFSDFFQTFDSLFSMALRSIEGVLWMEKSSVVYDEDNTLIDIGDCIDVALKPALEYFYNEIEVGSPKVDLRHPSGRLEFNSTNTFSIPLKNISNKLDIVTKYRTGCYDATFLVLDYIQQSTVDNEGDKSVFVLDITDLTAFGNDLVETFEEVTVDNAMLEPIIKSPSNEDRITFDRPTIKGIANPGLTVNVYVDGALDGGTTSDVNGNWSYNIVTPLDSFIFDIQTGEHLIQATFSDLAAPSASVNIIVDTNVTTPIEILYPRTGDSLYNNKPLIKGVAQFGTPFNLNIKGLDVLITPDQSCKWEYKIIDPFLNGTNHIFAGTDTETFQVNSSVAYPLITYIGSELDGHPIIDNLPLIEGVAIPGTHVTVYLNYNTFANLGTVVANASGNWSLPVIVITYPDPVTGVLVSLTPIPNGLNIISTLTENKTVNVGLTGYTLNRPAFSLITGVDDNSVFNVNFSPKRMLMNHKGLFAAILNKIQNEKVYFQTADKNGNLRTTLDGVTIAESDDVPYYLLGNPFAVLEIAEIKTKTLNSFSKTLLNFNQGGIIKTNFRGTDLYFLPIGDMKMETITSDVQTWTLLVATMTTYSKLLNLYKNGLKINLMQNSLFHSDYNTLHFVTYNFQDNPKYNFKTRYDDWFEKRNEAWLLNPIYIQKVQRTDMFRDQIITNGLSNIELNMYRCSDAHLITQVIYAPVSPAPIPLPDVVMEANIDLSLYPEAQYFFTISVNNVDVCISERIMTADKWRGTILIESSSSINKTGAFFSSGFQTVLRVEGLVKKLQPQMNYMTSTQEDGDTEMLYSSISRKRTLRFGTAYGLPDYLYLKISEALALDELYIEGVGYTLLEGEAMEPLDETPGHPLYCYNVNMALKANAKGKVFAGSPSSTVEGVVVVLDAEAFGLPVGSLINIELQPE